MLYCFADVLAIETLSHFDSYFLTDKYSVSDMEWISLSTPVPVLSNVSNYARESIRTKLTIHKGGDVAGTSVGSGDQQNLSQP